MEETKRQKGRLGVRARAGATRKRRRRASAALLDEEAKRFIGQGTIGTKDETYVAILWKRVFADPTDMLLRLEFSRN
mgnify:FL=1